MRFSLVFLVLATALITENVRASKINIAPLLKVALRFLLLNIKRMGNITLTEDYTFIIPKEVKNISTGSINLKNARIYGFETLDITELDVNNIDTTDNNNVVNVYLNLLITQFGISSNYDADAGIVDEIPIYGDGEINLAMSNINFVFCLNINISEDFAQFSVDNVTLSLELHDSPSYITRFWKNDSVSDLISAVINILEKIVLMWLDYEKECVSCVLSPVIQYAINSILPNDLENELSIKCSCLQGTFGKEIDVEGMLEKLVTSYHEGSVTNLLTSTNPEQLKEVFGKIENKILQVLRNEGFSIEA